MIKQNLHRVVSTTSFAGNSINSPRFGHQGASAGEQLLLMIRIVCSSVSDVVENLFSLQAIPFCDGESTNRTEGALRVNEQTLALTTTHIYWELARHRQRMAQL